MPPKDIEVRRHVFTSLTVSHHYYEGDIKILEIDSVCKNCKMNSVSKAHTDGELKRAKDLLSLLEIDFKEMVDFLRGDQCLG